MGSNDFWNIAKFVDLNLIFQNRLNPFSYVNTTRNKDLKAETRISFFPLINVQSVDHKARVHK